MMMTPTPFQQGKSATDTETLTFELATIPTTVHAAALLVTAFTGNFQQVESANATIT
jgi:stress response protein SCP2